MKRIEQSAVPVPPTLAEGSRGGGQVLGRQDVELQASADGLETGGQVELAVAHLEGWGRNHCQTTQLTTSTARR